MRKTALTVLTAIGLTCLGGGRVLAQSGARTSDVIGTYYGSVQLVLDTDFNESADHNFPQLILTGLVSYYLGWNDVGFHEGAESTMGFNGQTLGGIFFMEGLPYAVRGDFLVVPYSNYTTDDSGKNNTDVDYQLDITSMARIGLGVPTGEIENVVIAGKLKKGNRNSDRNTQVDSGAGPVDRTHEWSLDNYLEVGRGNRKVRLEDTDRDKIAGDTVVWMVSSLGMIRYDEEGSPYVVEGGNNTMTIEQYLFEVARISKTPGLQTFGDRVRIRR